MSKTKTRTIRLAHKLDAQLVSYAARKFDGNVTAAACAILAEKFGQLHDYADGEDAQHSVGASFVRRWLRGGGND